VTGIDFRFHKAPSFHIRGKAVDSSGQPIRHGMIAIRPSGSSSFEHTQIQPDGTFDARGVVRGSYILMSQTQQELSARQDVNVGDHDVDDIALIFRPPLEISGALRLEGKPAERKGSMQVALNAIDIGSSASTVVNADGSFSVKVMPAIYQLSAFCDAGAYVKSMRFGDQDVSGGRLDLTQQTGGALSILCGTDVGRIKGSVQKENGEPAAQAVITLSPEGAHEGRRDLYYQLNSDQSGTFEYQDIAPGDYKVFAWEGGDQEMLLSIEFRKAFESRAAAISISPAGNVSIQLKMIPMADIEAEKDKLP
jgi:hypothetical protein